MRLKTRLLGTSIALSTADVQPERKPFPETILPAANLNIYLLELRKKSLTSANHSISFVQAAQDSNHIPLFTQSYILFLSVFFTECRIPQLFIPISLFG